MRATPIKMPSSMSAIRKLAVLALLFIAGVQPALAERKTTFFHTDALGSVIAASNQQGALLWRKEYAPYGEQIDATQDSEALAYTGKQHDEVTGLTYFGARYYDPEIGRFLSIDPVGFVESNPMSFNRYLYVNDNPYKYVDPDGEFLNFAAKFVLDVGVNIAFNYVTTGGLGIGSALKESAVGILNPAKTMAKAGRLATALTKVSKKVDSRKVAGDAARGAAGLADDAARVASGGSPNRIYSARELVRRAAEPGPYHNFPESFNAQIFRGNRQVISENYVLYTQRGSINGASGTFEIGVRPSVSGRTETTLHRFFRPDGP